MRKLSLLLALITLLSVFLAACDNTPADVSGAVSDVNSETSSKNETSSEESKEEVSKDPVREDAQKTVISNGASYTKSEQAGEAYPDSYGTELTDGIRCVSNSYGDEATSGYTINGNTLNVIVDLGYVEAKLHSFKVSYLATTQAGINAPSRLIVAVSKNGKNWTTVGTMQKPTFEEGTMQEATLDLENYAAARYVKFMISGSSAWVFLDEVQVIADVEKTDTGKAYQDAINEAYLSLGTINAPQTGVKIDRDLVKTLISAGKGYKIVGETSKTFPDNGKMLTDGNLSGYYEGGTWVGFKTDKDVLVTIDLGTKVNDISSVEAAFYTNTTVGQYLPVAVKVVAISDKDERTDLGIVYASSTRVSGNYTFALQFEEAVSAKKIEFTFIATDSTVFLVEELGVYAYREAESVETLYPMVSIDSGATPWDKSSEGYNEYLNLILGKTQQIVVGQEPDSSVYKDNTPITSKLMTDGKFATTTNIHNGFFFKFCRGGSRLVIYDLEHVSSVDKFTASFTHQSDWAVLSPSNVTVLVSPDGEKWYEAGTFAVTGDADPSIYKGSLTLDKAVKAKYVAFSFAVNTWVGCDELEVYGKKNSTKAEEPSKLNLNEVDLFKNKRKEPSEDLLGGSKDLCLLYHGTQAFYDVDDLIPYLAYLDRNGEMKDTMFDSFLFLMTGAFPSGAKPYDDGKLSDWKWAIDDLFVKGENLLALEEAAAQVKQTLGLDSNFKYKVTMSIYYPSVKHTNFGDIDGDGKNENFSKIEDRIKAIETYIDMFEKKFNEQGFKNIELVGYYWYHEAINSGDIESMQLLNATSEKVHEVGKDFFWIPYFQSNGYESWNKYGFDVACMQPNYVFKLETPYSNVPICAELTKLYGMGVEMEICGDSLVDERFFKKYMEYIEGGIRYGYMSDCVIMYYQDVYAFRNACNSKTEMGRMVYEYTYGFIKDSLKSSPEKLDNQQYETTVNTPLHGKIETNSTYLNELRVALSPKSGTVTLNNDGTFTFYPEKDFKGDVTFAIEYSEYLGWSEPCVITVTVK